MFKKLSDEAQCGVFILVWEIFFLIAIAKNSAMGWAFFSFETITQLVWLYFFEKSEAMERTGKRRGSYFSRLSADYVDYIRQIRYSGKNEGSDHYDHISKTWNEQTNIRDLRNKERSA